ETAGERAVPRRQLDGHAVEIDVRKLERAEVQVRIELLDNLDLRFRSLAADGTAELDGIRQRRIGGHEIVAAVAAGAGHRDALACRGGDAEKIGQVRIWRRDDFVVHRLTDLDLEGLEVGRMR